MLNRASARAAGFTLIELVVAMAILAIITAFAIPSYREYVRRGPVEEAVAALGAGRVVAEQFFLDNRTYADMPCPGDTGSFAITCVSDDTTYTITATGSDNLAGFVYTIDETDQRTTDSPWGDGSCWITRKGGTC